MQYFKSWTKNTKMWHTFITIGQIFYIWFWLPQEWDICMSHFWRRESWTWEWRYEKCDIHLSVTNCHSSCKCHILMPHFQVVTPICHFPSLLSIDHYRMYIIDRRYDARKDELISMLAVSDTVKPLLCGHLDCFAEYEPNMICNYIRPLCPSSVGNKLLNFKLIVNSQNWIQ